MITKTCPHCNNTIDENSVYCPYCGRLLPTGKALQKEDEKRTSLQISSKFRFLSYIITLLLAISLFVNVYCFFIIRDLQNKSEIENIEEPVSSDQMSKLPEDDDPEQFYRVNKLMGIYHLPDCILAQDIPADSLRVSKSTRKSLEKEGFEPCDICIENANQVNSDKKYDYDAVEMKSINSLMFSSAGYDKSQKLLLLCFEETNTTYAYYDVPLNTYTNFLQSNNPDDYWERKIWRKYTSEKIE